MDSNQLKHVSVCFIFEPQNDITEEEWTEICQWIKRDGCWAQIPQWLKDNLSWEQINQWLKGNLPWEKTGVWVTNIYGLSQPVWRHFRLPQPGDKLSLPL
jgi:hypothetical protein